MGRRRWVTRQRAGGWVHAFRLSWLSWLPRVSQRDPLLVGLLALLVGTAAAGGSAPRRGDPQARLPSEELGGDYWDLLAAFDSGQVLFSVTAVHNLGPGDGRAVVVGLFIDPDGAVQRFSRSEEPRHWKLQKAGRRLDLRSIVLDMSGSPLRFVVDKNELRLGLQIGAQGPAAAIPAAVVSSCPQDVLEAASPAQGTFWRAGMAQDLALQGWAALTHRWMRVSETRCTRRRFELYARLGKTGLYFTEVETPEGALHRFATVVRGGVVVSQGVPERADVRWSPGPEGRPVATGLRLAVADLDLALSAPHHLASFRPLDGQPRWIRRVLDAEPEVDIGTGQLGGSFAGRPVSVLALLKTSSFVRSTR